MLVPRHLGREPDLTGPFVRELAGSKGVNRLADFGFVLVHAGGVDVAVSMRERVSEERVKGGKWGRQEGNGTHR